MDAETAALFPDGFEDSELGQIPRGWEVGCLLARAELLSGGTPRTSHSEYWGGGIPWATAKDVSQCGQAFLTLPERSITALGLDASPTKMIPAFTTVVVARGATTGRLAMLAGEMAMNQTCYALRSTTGTPFALYSMLAHWVPMLVQSAHGSVFDTITTRTFSTQSAVLPSLAVCQAFEAVVHPMFQIVLSNQRQAEALAAARDALLPKLLSGEMRVNR